MEVMELQHSRISVLHGLFAGAAAWTVYAVVECLFSSVLPWALKAKLAYIPVHNGFTVLLFVLYSLAGLSLGGLSGQLYRALAPRVQSLRKIKAELLLPAVATSTIVLVFSINLAVYSTTRSLADVFFLSVSLLLVTAQILSVLSQAWTGRLLFLTNPWTTCMILVGSSWLTKTYLLPEQSLAIKAGSVSAYIVTIILISIFIRKLLAGRRAQDSTATLPALPVKYYCFLGFVALFVLGMGFALHEAPQVVESESTPILREANPPNVLLITMDTVRKDHLSIYGYERDTTPHLKEFSEDATLFTEAASSGSMTLTAHASLFSGLYARQHGAHHDLPTYPRGRPLDDKFLTMAEILSARGYQTMGVAANLGYLGTAFGLQQGFQYYDNRRPVPFLGAVQGYFIRRGIRDFMTRFAAASDFDRRTRRAEEVNKETFKLLDKVKSNGRPFFLFINYMDAHWPYLPPPPYDTLYPGKDETFTLEHYFELMEKVLKQERKIRPEEYRHLISQYDGGIAYLDFHIGHLIDQLKKLGLYENTLIIVTSDHGEAFGERDLIEHGISVYQDLVHVPLIIKYPNSRQKMVVDDFVSVVDILPTVMEVLGGEVPIGCQGQSLTTISLEKKKIVISEEYPKGVAVNWHPRFNKISRAIFSGTFKYISSTSGDRELYDLSQDPNETNNLCNVNNDLTLELEAKLQDWLATVKDEHKSSTKTKLDPDAYDRLKSLGYIK